VLDEHEDFVGIAPFVVIPRNDFDERVRQRNACAFVENRRAGIAEEVGRNNCVFGVAENAFEFAFGGFFHCRADFVVFRRFREIDREVNDGNVERRNAHGHTSEFSVEFGENFADRFRRACGRRNDVARSSTSTAPVFFRRTVNRFLCRRRRVNRRHQTVFDAPVVIENFRDRREAVRRARRIRNDLHVFRVFVEVDAANEHRGIFRRSRDDDFLCASLDVRFRFGGFRENARGFNDVLCADFAPRNFFRIHFRKEFNFFAVHDNRAVRELDVAFELTVHRVITKHVSHVVRRHKRIVDADELNFRIVQPCAEDEASDTAETIDTNFDSHCF